MWGKIMIPVHRLWLHGLYGLHGPNVRCPKKAIKLSHSLTRLLWCQCVKSLWPTDTIIPHRSGSTLAQVMDCCMMTPNHYLNWYWLQIILPYIPLQIHRKCTRYSAKNDPQPHMLPAPLAVVWSQPKSAISIILLLWLDHHVSCDVYGPSQWEIALHWNAISHWLDPYTLNHK